MRKCSFDPKGKSEKRAILREKAYRWNIPFMSPLTAMGHSQNFNRTPRSRTN